MEVPKITKQFNVRCLVASKWRGGPGVEEQPSLRSLLGNSVYGPGLHGLLRGFCCMVCKVGGTRIKCCAFKRLLIVAAAEVYMGNDARADVDALIAALSEARGSESPGIEDGEKIGRLVERAHGALPAAYDHVGLARPVGQAAGSGRRGGQGVQEEEEEVPDSEDDSEMAQGAKRRRVSTAGDSPPVAPPPPASPSADAAHRTVPPEERGLACFLGGEDAMFMLFMQAAALQSAVTPPPDAAALDAECQCLAAGFIAAACTGVDGVDVATLPAFCEKLRHLASASEDDVAEAVQAAQRVAESAAARRLARGAGMVQAFMAWSLPRVEAPLVVSRAAAVLLKAALPAAIACAELQVGAQPSHSCRASLLSSPCPHVACSTRPLLCPSLMTFSNFPPSGFLTRALARTKRPPVPRPTHPRPTPLTHAPHLFTQPANDADSQLWTVAVAVAQQYIRQALPEAATKVLLMCCHRTAKR